MSTNGILLVIAFLLLGIWFELFGIGRGLKKLTGDDADKFEEL